MFICLAQEDDASDHEAAMSVDEEPSSGGDAEAQAEDQALQGESSSCGKKQKNQKKKFDISLPAQHLVSWTYKCGLQCNPSLSLSLSLSPLPIVSW